MTTGHRINCCSIAFIENQVPTKAVLQQLSVTMTSFNTEASFQDSPSDVECPDSWCAQTYIVSKRC